MNRPVIQQQRHTVSDATLVWVHLAIGIALLALAAVMDLAKPWGKSWTIFYLLPMLYVGSKVRNLRIEVPFYFSVTVTTFLVPFIFHRKLLLGGTGIFNRSLGALVGTLVIFLIWERRRYVSALEEANQELERRVASRVEELKIANDKLADDIQQRQRAEQQLRESEARFRTFVDHATDAFFLHDHEGIVRDVNQQACDSLGYTRNELVGMSPLQFDPEMTIERLREVAERLNAGETVRFDSVHRRKDGSQFPVEVRIRPFISQGQCLRVALAHDISQRKKSEQELRESEQRFQQLSDSAFEGLMIHEQGVIRDANQVFASLFGFQTVRELIGRHCLELIPLTAESKERIRQQLRSPLDSVFEITTQWPDGTIRILETQGRDTLFQGRAARVAALRDVTERKQAEEERRRLEQQVQQAQKLESLGVMAGGVAHDFNNLLTVINGNSHLLRTNLEQNDPRQGFAAAIHAAGAQAAKLTRQLLMFSRGVPQQPEALDINQVIEQSAEIWRQVVGEKIEVIIECSQGLWPVVVDRSQIEQVLLNLVLNARDAMPNGGQIGVKTSNRDLPQTAINAAEGSPPRRSESTRFVQISVQDNGVGMSESVRARIFEPFFTTKNVGQGTGLGLPMCHGIVRHSGGWIQVDSQPGRGSTFSIVLPSHMDATSMAPKAPMEAAEVANPQ